MPTRRLASVTGVVLLTVIVVAPVEAYIHFPPQTMPKMCEMSRAIRVLTVKKHDKDKGVIVYEAAETLKGKTPEGTLFKHAIGKQTKETNPIYDWVGDGKQALMFTLEAKESDIACGYVFIDEFCYSVDHNKRGNFWLLIRVDPEMGAILYGKVETLQQVTKDLLAGKEVKVPVDKSVKALTVKEREKLAPALSEVLTKNRQN
ncbi:MAG TPA: hypothetical protein VG122_19270 [Gemmata sp.]|jgi:hypothetical protein|nr:hypothetical protein [Gemmata sp.]